MPHLFLYTSQNDVNMTSSRGSQSQLHCTNVRTHLRSRCLRLARAATLSGMLRMTLW